MQQTSSVLQSQSVFALVNKSPRATLYAIIDQLCEVRNHFGLRDKAVAVLRALASFAQEVCADGYLVVWPSNATLSQRLEAMPVSTLNRNISKLIDAGLLVRKASGNFKRFACRNRIQQRVQTAFGFDLTPLLNLSATIADMVKRERETSDLIRSARAQLLSLRRSLPKECDLDIQVSKLLRRKASLSEYQEMVALVEEAVCRGEEEISIAPCPIIPSDTSSIAAEEETQQMGSTIAQNEQHHLNKKKNNRKAQQFNLECIKAKLPTALSFSPEPIDTFSSLVSFGLSLIPMIGVRPNAMNEIVHALGEEISAIITLVVVDRFEQVQCPSAYLKAIALEYTKGRFDLMNLLDHGLRNHMPDVSATRAS